MIRLLFLALLLPAVSLANAQTTDASDQSQKIAQKSKIKRGYVRGMRRKHSLSAQIGLNGAMSDKNSFGLQALPPDMSYSYKLFDDNKYMVSTSTFYDNIGVQMDDVNFFYRVGQRFDAGYEIKDTFIYGTLGLGYMVMQGTTNGISPVYGFGIAKDISRSWAVMSELNFQNIKSQTIVNLSVGVIYSLDI